MFVYTESEVFISGGSIVFDNGDIYRTVPPKRAYLSYLVVREEFRNKGIGTEIIDYITE
ncbi:GNAT family N-acetyltransferase [Clostridium cellulovorans]|uniref:GNAT family N-acetyltransferase n=1 Tax=Clostridium cellulovorans TaxID=1493 RepID=UPI0001A96E0D|nr:GNAT family N-acetyltransferase [Clostridium cellulovorans]